MQYIDFSRGIERSSCVSQKNNRLGYVWNLYENDSSFKKMLVKRSCLFKISSRHRFFPTKEYIFHFYLFVETMLFLIVSHFPSYLFIAFRREFLCVLCTVPSQLQSKQKMDIKEKRMWRRKASNFYGYNLMWHIIWKYGISYHYFENI